LENAILNLPEGQEQMSWLIDYTGLSLNTNISVKTARDIIHILQNHYPERLAIAFLYNPPRIFQAFWKVCSAALQVTLRLLFSWLYLYFLKGSLHCIVVVSIIYILLLKIRQYLS